MVIFSLLPLSLFAFKAVKLFYIYKHRIGATMMQSLAGGLAGLSLAHTISRAVLLGFVTKGIPFFRTPKLAERQNWLDALAMVREEAALLLGLWLVAATMVFVRGVDAPDLLFWVIVLLVQSLSYLAAVIVSLVSTSNKLPTAPIGLHELKRPVLE